MQSSGGSFFRGLMMLVCLVVVPVVALFGNELSVAIKRALGVQPLDAAVPPDFAAAQMASCLSLGPTASGMMAPTASDQPPQWPGAAPATYGVVPTSGASVDAPAWNMDMASPQPATPAVYQEPVAATLPGEPAPMAADWPARPLIAPDSQGGSMSLAPVDRTGDGYPSMPGSITETSLPSSAQAPATLPSPTVPQGGVDRFSAIQQRLRDLGATYYLLELWGSERKLYRFYCQMAIGGNASYTRHFEQTDLDPLQAMARVLNEVEAWRAGQM